jgi:hypothetical protein
MISDREVWQCAAHGEGSGADAIFEAATRADRLLDERDMAGASVWHRILNAMERLQATKPADDGAVQ